MICFFSSSAAFVVPLISLVLITPISLVLVGSITVEIKVTNSVALALLVEGSVEVGIAVSVFVGAQLVPGQESRGEIM
jgi:hypothetical protein